MASGKAEAFNERVAIAMDFLLDLAKAIITLFIIVDPFGNIPIFIGLTKDLPRDARQRVFKTAVFTGVILLLFFALVGHQVFTLFGISIHSFMIAGGLLLLIIAIRILVRGEWEEKPTQPESIGVVPIAFPLLVGPGAITTTILSLQTSGVLVAILSVLAVFAVVQIILAFIEPIYNFLGSYKQ
ncbi:MAG: MarC family protein, partial [Moorella sp. (in: Bacteria)]|nr:MarC family protein [Moorella sp. (in: firmicutes)]